MNDKRQSVLLAAVVLICVMMLLPDLLRRWRFWSSDAEGSRNTPELFSDYTTPENALRSLENAYRRRDIEAAVRSKDFVTEARLMLKKLDEKHGATTSPYSEEDEVVRRTAEVLERSFRKQTTEEWPDFHGLECSVTHTEPYAADVIVATERCRFPDGGHSTQRMLLGRTSNGWRVLNPID